MTFSDFTKIFFTYTNQEIPKYQFVLELTDNIIETNDVIDCNPLASYQRNTLNKIFQGQSNISNSKASKLLAIVNREKFCDYLSYLDDSTIDKIKKAIELHDCSLNEDDLYESITDLFINIISNISEGKNETVFKQNTNNNARTLFTLKDNNYFKDNKFYLGNDVIDVSPIIFKEINIDFTLPYIDELIKAYNDDLHTNIYNINNIDKLPSKYKFDFYEQKNNFYSAEVVHHSLRDVFDDGEEHFTTLKDEIFSGVYQSLINDYPTAFIRLQQVMEKACIISIDKSIITQIKNYIGNSEKKGICHILVNEGKIKGWISDEDCAAI